MALEQAAALTAALEAEVSTSGQHRAAAEMLAEQHHISRERMESFALASHEKATVATKKGHFANE